VTSCGAGCIFQHIAGGADLKALHQVVLIFVHGEEEDFGLGAVLLDVPCRLEGREARHADIHEHDIGTQVAGLLDRLARVSGLACYFKIAFAFQQPPNSLAEECVIVNQQAFDLWHC